MLSTKKQEMETFSGGRGSKDFVHDIYVVGQIDVGVDERSTAPLHQIVLSVLMITGSPRVLDVEQL